MLNSPSSPSMLSISNPNETQSLKGRQVNAIRQMLKITSSSGDNSNPNPDRSGSHPRSAAAATGNNNPPQWKVLIFDRVGQDILAPIMNVKALREEGVTLHLLISSDRDPVPDVPAIYLCQPTEENLRKISEDLRNKLYGSYYFNFTSPISRQRLEELATAALQVNATAQVRKLYDQYVNFISLESNMFTLRHQSNSSLSFHALNKTSVTDTDMDSMINQIVESLFAVCVTLGTIPIIRCPKGNAAEAVATKLDKKLRENLRDARSSLFVNDGIQAGQFSFYRPLLLIMDRQFDLATPLHHTWTYQALAHDVLQYSLNRVTITEGGNSTGDQNSGAIKKKKTRSCDLDNQDLFWMSHKGSPFPLVAEKIQEELEEYRSREDDIKRMKHEMGVDGESDFAIGMLSDNTQRLTSAVSSLPALLEKKRFIDMHTSIAMSILEQIKLRRLDAFFELEEKVMSKQALAEKSLSELLTDPEVGTPEDKMRLFIIDYLCNPDHNADTERLASTLEEFGCDMAAFKYLKWLKSLTNMTQSASVDYGGGGTKTVSMFSKLVSHGSNFVMEGVKNLVVKKHNLPVTKVVEELMEIRSGQYQDNFLYFDPKILKQASDSSNKDHSSSVPRAKNPFQEAIVFMVGGGNYIEYQNLVDFTANKNNMSISSSSANLMGVATNNSNTSNTSNHKRIIYGCTTLVNANQMMQQLAELGHEM